ncbi:nucleoside diphosphate kinase [Leuconostoc litchii]|uniref:Nucleoside diphosphate kinase n=1 Tax=Leuconostoc litchii TaxID=1981069 RepID=A0A6P2CMS7_9LACO|nr:nucleoside-diphosphate kinase [Leuconostoc litchii]TYC46204.1 nucleoside-diphosphate kinase [Leuconostoc litchii]GMA70336.1 nucleoside diphosphate kinase [Leuconostoc litchii]
MVERTFMMIKPDGVARGKIGEIIQRIEHKGYVITAIKMVRPTHELLAKHYAEHLDKPFYPSLVRYMTSGPVVAMIGEGTNIVTGWRMLMGETNPTLAAPGTIRGDLGREWSGDAIKNIVHGSDSITAAEYEISLWFS